MNKVKIYAGVIGGRQAAPSVLAASYELGGLIAREDWILVCGGMSGIMEKACQGAYKAGGVTIGILPVNNRTDGNPYLTYSIPTGLGEARNSIVVKSAHMIFALDGGFGTLSEIAFAHLYGIPVIGLFSWKMVPADNHGKELFVYEADNPPAAVKYAKKALVRNTG